MRTLPLRLREATRALHRQAESASVMDELLRGLLPLAAYRALLAELLPLYDALETALQAQRRSPWLEGFDLAALERAPALRADLAGAAAPRAPRPATRAYVGRLQALGRLGDPALLGHVYTRYLGDLHGGQILRRVVERRYPGQGTAFHDFGDAARVARLRDRLSLALEQAPLAAAESDRVVAEACWSFEQHGRLFGELAAA